MEKCEGFIETLRELALEYLGVTIQNHISKSLQIINASLANFNKQYKIIDLFAKNWHSRICDLITDYTRKNDSSINVTKLSFHSKRNMFSDLDIEFLLISNLGKIN